jgi:hypothetical protein
MGFTQSALDPYLFLRYPGLPTLQMIYIYVDNILVFCAYRLLLNALKAKIKERFAIKDLGILVSGLSSRMTLLLSSFTRKIIASRY